LNVFLGTLRSVCLSYQRHTRMHTVYMCTRMHTVYMCTRMHTVYMCTRMHTVYICLLGPG